MSWRPEFVDDSGKRTTNGLRFGTKKEAEDYVLDLAMRWTSVRDTRVVECDDPVNYTYHDHQLRRGYARGRDQPACGGGPAGNQSARSQPEHGNARGRRVPVPGSHANNRE